MLFFLFRHVKKAEYKSIFLKCIIFLAPHKHTLLCVFLLHKVPIKYNNIVSEKFILKGTVSQSTAVHLLIKSIYWSEHIDFSKELNFFSELDDV